MFKAYQSIGYAFVKRYKGRFRDYDEIIQAARIGIMLGIRKRKSDQDQEIRRSVYSWVRYSVVSHIQRELLYYHTNEHHGNHDLVLDSGECLYLKKKKYDGALTPYELKLTRLYFVCDYSACEIFDIMVSIKSILTANELKLLRFFFFFDYSTYEIAKIVFLSKETIRKQIKVAIGKLNRSFCGIDNY